MWHIIVSCVIVIVLMQRHTYRIHAMQCMKYIKSFDICQLRIKVKKVALTQQYILLEAGQCIHCSYQATQTLPLLPKWRNIVTQSTLTNSHQFQG
jgi:hypothetical protein